MAAVARIALSLLCLATLVGMGPGHPRVIDGDTLEMGSERIRLKDMDAPELAQQCLSPKGESFACGAEATERLRRIIAGRPVACAPEGRDDYGRILARCFVEGQDIAETLVQAGYGFAFTRYGDAYLAAQIDAAKEGRGLWAGSFDFPWDFRSGKWAVADPDVPDPRCPIKGNINRKGERIYHVPWAESYARTRIDTSKGERWFCDEAEAQRAGWRAPRN